MLGKINRILRGCSLLSSDCLAYSSGLMFHAADSERVLGGHKNGSTRVISTWYGNACINNRGLAHQSTRRSDRVASGFCTVTQDCPQLPPSRIVPHLVNGNNNRPSYHLQVSELRPCTKVYVFT